MDVSGILDGVTVGGLVMDRVSKVEGIAFSVHGCVRERNAFDIEAFRDGFAGGYKGVFGDDIRPLPQAGVSAGKILPFHGGGKRLRNGGCRACTHAAGQKQYQEQQEDRQYKRKAGAKSIRGCFLFHNSYYTRFFGIRQKGMTGAKKEPSGE
jgi:hypothetical protein